MDVKSLLNRNRQRQILNEIAYQNEVQEMIDDLEQQENARKKAEKEKADKAARDRQEYEELKKRAVDEMAKQDETNAAEHTGSKKTQNSEAVAEMPRSQILSFIKDQFQDKKEPKQKAASYKLYESNKKPQDKYYPKGIFGFTPKKLDDKEYYEQLKQSYLESLKDDSELRRLREEDMQMMTGGNYIPSDFKWDFSSRASTAFGKWIDNTIGYFNQKKNETEVSAYQGQIFGRQELRGRLQDVYNYQKLVDDFVNAQEHLAKNPNSPQTIALIQNIQRQLPQAAEAARVASTYLDQAIAKPLENDAADAGSAFMPLGAAMLNQSKRGYQKTIQGLVENLNQHVKDNDVNGIRTVSSELNKIGISQVEKWDKQDEDSREGMRKNIQELENWKKWRKIDPEFLSRAEAASQELSFTDPDTYLYGLSGVLGSSASFNGLQWANMALSAAGARASATGVGALAGAPMIATGFMLGIESGKRENEAEMSEAINGVFLDKLQKNGEYKEFVEDASKKLKRDVTFEEAMQAMALGEYEPSEKIKKTFVNSTFGANNLFMHDMLAVTGDNIFETAVSVVPFGKFAKSAFLKPGSKVAKLRRLAKFKQAHPEIYGKAAAFTENLSEGAYNLGATINPILGAGTAVGGALMRPLIGKVGKSQFVKGVSAYVTENLAKKFGTIADWAYKAPKTVLNTKVVGRTGLDWTKRFLGTSFAESIEEGKQYYNQKEFAAGNYAGESDSIWDLLLGDIEGGSKSALQFTGSFLGMSTDKEWITNMRGGFLAGGGHTGVVAAYGNIRNAAIEIQANNLAVNNILATKLQERTDIEKGRMYASRSSFADRKAMNQVFDNIKELQHQITERGKQLGNPEMEGISDEAIEEQRQMYNRIFNLANNEEIRKAARERGINPGSDRYATLISLIDFTDQEKKRAIEGISDKTRDIRQLINQTLWNTDIDISTATDDELLELANKVGLKYKRSSSPILTNEAIEENRRNRRIAMNNRTNLVDYIAHLDALLSQRDQLELKDSKTSADKRKLRSINQQIETLRNSVKDRVETTDEEGNTKIQLKDNELSIINTASDLQRYIYDIDLHEIVRDQYRDVNNYTIDLDHALAMQYNLIGDKVTGVEQVNDQQVNEILQNVDNHIREQYEKTVALTDNKNVKKKETGFSVDTTDLNEKAAKKASSVIDEYLNSVKEDEQFEQEIHDDMEKALEELYGRPEQTENNVEEEISQPQQTEEIQPEPVVSDTTSDEVIKPEELEQTQQEDDGSKLNLPKYPTLALQEAFGDYYEHYIENSPLVHILNEGVDQYSEPIRQEIQETVKKLNSLIKKAEEVGSRNNGYVTKAERWELIKEYEDIAQSIDNIVEKIDSEEKLKNSEESKPKQEPSTAITNEDIVDSHTSDAKKWLDDFYATINSKLEKVQEFLQTQSSAEGFDVTPEGQEEVKQAISDLDALFNQDEVVEGLININPATYAWYFGNGVEPGARQRALNALNTEEETLPDPVIPENPSNNQPPVSPTGTTKFDENPINDQTDWNLLTNTTWYNPKYGEGLIKSVSTTDSNLRLVDVMNNSDFITNAKFEFVFKGANQPFVIVHYKGHTFTPVFVQTANNQNRSRGFAFWTAIKTALQKVLPNQMVSPVRVSRSFGSIKRTDDNGNPVPYRSLTELGLINDSNMYELEFSPNQDSFGITEERVNSDGISVITVYTPSEGGRGHQIIYEYSNSSNNDVQHGDKPSSGVPVFLYDRKYDELGNRKAQVPVNMQFTKLTIDDATLILEILKGQHCADRNAHGPNILAQEYVQDDGRGNIIEYGMTNGEVLNLLLRYGYKYPTDRRHIHLEYNNEDNRKVSLVGFVQGEDKFDPNKPDEIPTKEFNLFDENQAEAFVNAIAGVINRNFSQQYASSRVGDNFAESTNPFSRLNQKRQSSLALQKMLENGGKIKFGNSAIEFDMKDFVNEADPKSTGVSGMVWYARHGFLNAQFNGFEYTLLVFDEDAGVTIVDRDVDSQKSATDRAVEQNEELPKVDPETPEQKAATAAVEEEVPPVVTRKSNKTQIIIDEDELAKREVALPKEDERVSFEEGKQHIIDILGDKFFTVEELHSGITVEQAINMFKNGPAVLGLCKQSMIKLSRFARKGTEYHEAFHRVVEILLNDKQRQKVYKAYAKAKHIKLYDNNDNVIVENMKLVTEGLADEFMMYMNDKPTVKLTWNLKQLWSSIKNWVNFYKSIGSITLYKMYRDVNRGKYKNVQPTPANKKRFEELLKLYKTDALNFSINGKAFKHILNHRQYKNLCDTMVYILYQSQKNIDRAGRNMQDFKMDNADVIRKYKLFQKYAAMNPALIEMLDNWDIVRKDIRSKIEQIATPYIGTNDNEDNVEDMQGDEESVKNAGIGDYTRDSAEFSQFSRAGEKVKHFFALIPAVKYAYNEQGSRIIVSVNNTEGLPHFVNASTMYNTVLNQVYNCRSLSELIDKLNTVGEENAQFKIIHDRIQALKESADKGNVEDATLLTQMCVNLHASKGEYVICKAKRTKSGGFDLTIQPTDSDYAARNNRYEWSSLFAGGASKYIEQDADGNYVMKGSFKPSVFKTLADFLNEFKRAVSPVGIQSIGDKSKKPFAVPVRGEDGKIVFRELDVTNGQDLAFAKAKFISILNNLGIMFNIDMLNYMLNTKYGRSDYYALNKLFTENSQNDISVFAGFINGFNNNGKLNVAKTDNGWTINSIPINSVFNGRFAGFVSELSKWAYNYKKSQDQLSVLANKQNRQYLISENNYITDTIDDMNVSIEGDTQKIDDLKSFVYNWFKPENGSLCSSVILRNYSSGNPKKLRVVTDSGFKTDAKGDIGEDYAEISQAQDEVSKMEMLLRGKIILPTMSDKKTWGYIDGLALPGLNIESPIIGQFINSVQVNQKGGYQFSQNRDVLEQLRQYAILEYQAVVQTLKDVKGYVDPITGEVHAPMKEEEKVQNYHKASVKVNGKSYSIVQGARFSSMYAIYDSKGKKISFNRVCDENGKFISEEDNLAVAMDNFFGVPSENEGMYWINDSEGKSVEVTADQLTNIQYQIISRSLQLQLRKQLLKAEKLGIIEKTTNDQSVPLIYRYKNKLISESVVRSIKSAIKQDLTDSQKESLAIAIIMNDVSCKSIMSLQETERIFSGHPSFYKWQYNSKGILSDRSTDQHKRFGGLVSTGQNNAFVFKDLPRTYKAAEINDLEIQSEHVEMVQRLMYEGELRSSYLRMMLNESGLTMADSKTDKAVELAKKADEQTIEQIEQALPKIALESIKRTAKQKSDAFRKSREEKLSGINVADGATYITDDMCENLLKQVGAYGEEIQRAFKVLRGEQVGDRSYSTKGIREMLSAWNLVYTTVIGTQKYTAYGFRKQNGVLVPYYNKTALFPMFKALCTGKTAKLYDKMKKDGIDMVMFNSAVKVGSQGSQDINWDTFDTDFTFNTYEQEYRYLRKQFNTDPKEKELMSVGTQMTKIAMSAMLPGREYTITDADGTKRTINASDLRDEIMSSINKLSEIGHAELKDKLFDGDRLNVEKFSKFLTEELAQRGASRDLLDAVSVVDENSSDIDEDRKERIKRTGKKELKVPLSALSGMNWIQSIINSKVNKSVIDINTPGAAFIQRSVFGMEGNTTMVSDKNLPPDIYEGRNLEFRNENGSMDCVLSIDFFENILPPNLSFAEARQWLIDNKIISGRMSNGEWSDADASIVGYRIPTQAQSSIHALRVVDVLPIVRDTVVLPAEFTKITGADFDIDKLFLSTLYYKKHDVTDKSGNVLSRTVDKDWKEGSKEYYANQLILDYIALLKDSKSAENPETRSMNFGDASIDSDTKLLTDIVEDLESSMAEEPLDPYDTYSLWRNTSIRDQFITGKFGIGPFALNNNNHILTMLYGVKFAHNPASILGITGHESLCDHEDMFGESIMSWLSGLINAHVDVAKDPYISRLNVNKYTYNLVNLMIRTGFGKTTFYFMTQPIMKELALRVNNAASAYGNNPNKSKYRRQKEAERDFIVEFANSYAENSYAADKKFKDVQEVLEYLNTKLRKLGTNKTALIKSIFDNKSDLLRQVVKSNKSYDDANTSFEIQTEKGTVLLEIRDLQLLIYSAKVYFDKYSDAVSKLVKYCKIDTKKQGKNIAEQRDFMRGYRNLFINSNSSLRKLFEAESLASLNDDSYIRTKTNLATKLFEAILSEQLVEATNSFNQQCESILFELPVEGDDISQQLAKKVSDSVLISIRSDFFNQYASRWGINIKGLVSGKNTIYDRLNKLKIDLHTKEEYEDLRNADGSIDNYLLQMLTSGFTHKQNISEDEKNGIVARAYTDTYDDAKFLSTMTFMDDDSIDADEVTAAWEELLEDTDHPELQQFARDLIVYSFITTGGNGGSNNIFKYIPTSWIVNPDNQGYYNSYAWFMSQKLENYRNGSGLHNSVMDDVILNNWTDNQFIPTIQLNGDFQAYYTGKAFIDVVNGRQVAPKTDIPIIIQCDPSKSNSRFIKINRAHDKESQRSVAIYKKVKVGHKKIEHVDENGKITYSYSPINIYVLTDPKGQNFGGKNKIYEYGRSDAGIRETGYQLSLNQDIVAIAELIGADPTDIESVLNKLISFVNSKQDKEAALDVLKQNGIDGVLYDAIVENVINRDLEDLSGAFVDTNEMESLYEYTQVEETYESPKVTPEIIESVKKEQESRTYGIPVEKSKEKQLEFLNAFLNVLDDFGSRGGEMHSVPYSEFVKFKDNTGTGEKITSYIYRIYGTEDLTGICEYDKQTKSMILNDWCYRMFNLFKMDYEKSHQWFAYLTDKYSVDMYEDVENLKSGIIDDIRKLENNDSPKVKQFDLYSAIKKYINEYGINRQNPEFTKNTSVKTQKESDTISVLKYIKENGSSEFYKNAAEILLRFVEAHPASVLFTPNVNYGASGHAVFDPKNPNDSYVELFIENDLYKNAPEGAIIHEITHNISQFITRIIENNSDEPIFKYIEYLKDNILHNKRLQEKGYDILAMEYIYGFKNSSEFVAEFMSNPMFCDILKQIPAMDDNKFNNIFEEVIDWICKVINKFFGNSPETSYEQIKPVVYGLMEIQKNLNYDNTNWGEQLSELLNEDQRFLTKSEVTRLKLRTKSYKILRKNKQIYRRGNKYYIQAGEVVYDKNNQPQYEYKFESLPARFEKIKQLLQNNSINPNEVLQGYNKNTGEIYFINIYDEDQNNYSYTKTVEQSDKFSQYRLHGKESFSELIRMQNDDPDLYREYLDSMGQDIEDKCNQ